MLKHTAISAESDAILAAFALPHMVFFFYSAVERPKLPTQLGIMRLLLTVGHPWTKKSDEIFLAI